MATWTGGAPGSSGRWDVVFGFWAAGNTQFNSSNYKVGARWESVTIPNSATITSATLTFTLSAGLTSGRLVGVHQVDNAPALADGQHSTGFTPTSTFGSGSGTINVDVTAAVQALVNRAGWVSGNALTVRVEGTASGTSTLSSPSLTVEYAQTHQVTVTADAASESVFSPGLVQPVTVTADAVSTAVFTPILLGSNVTINAVSATSFTATRFARAAVVAPASSAAVFSPASIQHPNVLAAATSGAVFSPGRVQAASVTVIAVTAVTVTLERYFPDPPTPEDWRTLVASDRFLTAVTGRAVTATMSVDVLAADGSGAVLARFGGPHERGPLAPTRGGFEQVKVWCQSDNGKPAWAFNVTSRDPSLLPGGPGAVDLLNPLQHNMVRAWWWLLVGDVWERVPVGTGTVDSVMVTDDDQGFVVTLLVRDMLADVARARWDETLQLGALPVSDAISRVLLSRAPWAAVAIPPSRERLPGDWAHGQPDSDPTDDLARLADAMGAVARTTRMGEFTVDPVQYRSSAAVRARIVEGVSGDGVTQLLSVDTTVTDMDQVVNACTVTSASPDVDPPVSGRFEITDPASPLRVDVRRYSRSVSNAIVTTAAQAATMARNYVERNSAQVEMTITHTPRPDLNPGDVVEVTLAEAGVWGRWTVLGWSLDSPTGPQSTTVATERTFT